MKPARALAVIATFLLIAAACGGSDPQADAGPGGSPDGDSTPAPTDTAAPVELVSAERGAPNGDPAIAGDSIASFGYRLHGALDADADPAANLVTSPASVAIALAMLEPGTSGPAVDELHAVLSITDPEAFHQSMNALEQNLETRVPPDYGAESDPGELELAIANAAYLQQGYPFATDYLDTIGEHYGPVVRSVDFAPDPDAVGEQINAFIAEATRDRITDLIAPGTIDPATVLALVNALYMKASWLEPFDAEATVDRPFTFFDGTATDVPMLHGFGNSSAEGDGWVGATKALTGGLTVEFVLPDPARFDEVEARIDTVFDELARNRTSGAELVVPRFETRVNTPLDEALKALGLTSVYDEGHLLGIADDPQLKLDKALHEVYLAVDEDGVEAAAATVLLAVATSGPPSPPVPVVLDRPFLFRIADQETGATLFVGRIADPTTGA